MKNCEVEQVKGITYSLESFLGPHASTENANVKPGKYPSKFSGLVWLAALYSALADRIVSPSSSAPEFLLSHPSFWPQNLGIILLNFFLVVV